MLVRVENEYLRKIGEPMSIDESFCCRPCHGTVSISLRFFGWTPSHERHARAASPCQSELQAHERLRLLRHRRGRYLSLTRSGDGGGSEGKGRGERKVLLPLRYAFGSKSALAQMASKIKATCHCCHPAEIRTSQTCIEDVLFLLYGKDHRAMSV